MAAQDRLQESEVAREVLEVRLRQLEHRLRPLNRSATTWDTGVKKGV